MPAIITPPDTERRRRDTEDGDHGGGRRPPTDKQTGGGGDPDNWHGRKKPRSPRERLDRYRLGLFFVLAAVFMFFVAIVSIFFVSQSSGHFDANARFINEWLPTAIPPILWLNTAVLLLSSLTIEIGRRHMFTEMHVMDEWLGLGKPTSRRAMPWVAATVTLGALFLAGQWLAWRQLAAERMHRDATPSPSSQSFYLFTGAHGAHVLLGVLLLTGALTALFTSRQIENRQIFVDLAAWYWHAMGLLWIMLFLLLAFFQG
jgi:cytochrome c oxidase subunit 3